MKKVTVLLACFVALSTHSFATPNEKILRSFERTFSSPVDVKWYEHPSYCEVSFVQQGIHTTVRYDLEGNFMSSRRYYKEQQLPIYILCKLRKKYADKIIFGVTEMTKSDEIQYFVKMEDAKSWITIKVGANGQMEVFEKFRKA